MADPFRLRLLKALTAVLEEITPDNGYEFDLTGKVFRGRDTFGESEPLPLVSILEAIEEQPQLSSPQAGKHSTGPWELLLQGFVEDDFNNPTDPAHRLMAEVKKRLIKERTRDRGEDIFGMDGLVTELRMSHGVVRPPDDISGKAYFWLRVTPVVVENLEDPYV
ncbi:hypothetical protein NAV33_07250 [Pseudomonas stutzeri]|uniref:hypothetical protein n=1 Tax=Stutzerimonas stutzeri TaxID=316 RepID=UPI00210972CE|nr:hypothetical protein [Stutzerimonas stutzeri]MCQ4311690.1 hypothetical protein [Stutzerimonas stutzeri]